MRIIIFVDLVLGPCLTLVVYKAGKKGLKLDLTCIGLLQVTCLAAGLYVVYSERPTFFIFYDGHFYSANGDTFERYGQTPPLLEPYTSPAPIAVIAKVPEDPIEEADFRQALYAKSIPVWIYEQGFEPLEENFDQVIAEAYSEEELIDRDSDQQIKPWLEKHGGALSDYAFYPIHSRYENPFIAIRRSDNQFVDVIRIPAPLGL